MTGAMIGLTMLGCFSLLRWYGLLAASGVLGLCWAIFAWATPWLPVTAPALLALVAGLVLFGWRRERAARA